LPPAAVAVESAGTSHASSASSPWVAWLAFAVITGGLGLSAFFLRSQRRRS
jgi:hypothetical protein